MGTTLIFFMRAKIKATIYTHVKKEKSCGKNCPQPSPSKSVCDSNV